MAVDAARAKSLFLTASDLTDPAERAAYLERECGGDAELRARVEALLAADGGAEGGEGGARALGCVRVGSASDGARGLRRARDRSLDACA